jgi:feruloyl esterase
MRGIVVFGAIIAAAGSATSALSQPADQRCGALRSFDLPGLEIVSAVRVMAGSVDAGSAAIEVPASCRVTAVSRPSADSEIGFELWLPDNWTGRYAQLGNGGFAGNIDHPSLAAEIRRGNAAAMTDTGHKAGQFDASWAQGHPEKVIDYGYRSTKATADAARGLIAAYYGRAARFRYFIGCSNGGRQALMAAQRYPDDWDGILAGSPAVYWTRQFAAFVAIQHRLRSDPKNWLPAEKLPAIQRAAVAGCATAKTSPWQCRLDTRRLICRGAETRNCLTTAQAATLDAIQGNPRRFGFAATAAAIPANWDQWILNPDQNAPGQAMFASQASRYLIPTTGEGQLPALLDAADPDLRRFKARGGKMIMYLGWSDALISPAAGLTYYQSVLRRMRGPASTQSFFRLFVAPGMQHCQGGVAPNSFGQAWVAPGVSGDPQHDIRSALQTWVEAGRPPQSLRAAMLARDNRIVIATQELRPYPRPAGPIVMSR